MKVTHCQSGEEILILSPRWKAELETLRDWDRKDWLLCPGCRQPVRVKAGSVKHWHFAHKHLANCPYERQSPLLLATRAVLYEWLVAQFGEERVALEKHVEKLPRPLDCYLSPPQDAAQPAIAYWIFDTRMPPDERQRLRDRLTDLNAHLIWVFAAPILNVEGESPPQINLTTTEREFRQQTESDAAQPAGPFLTGETLHYLDAETETLITYRSLNLRHSPQVYAGRRLESPLGEIRVDLSTGDFLHPGEAEKIAQHRQVSQHRQDKMQKTLPKLGARYESMLPAAGRSDLSTLFASTPSKKSPQPSAGNADDTYDLPFARIGTCKYCGKQTDDWVSFDGRTGTCVCRDCSGK